MQSLSEYIHDLLAGAEIYSNVTSQLMSWWGSSEKIERAVLFYICLWSFRFLSHLLLLLFNISETPQRSHKN